jgi:hypothetical protein
MKFNHFFCQAEFFQVYHLTSLLSSSFYILQKDFAGMNLWMRLELKLKTEKGMFESKFELSSRTAWQLLFVCESKGESFQSINQKFAKNQICLKILSNQLQN